MKMPQMQQSTSQQQELLQQQVVLLDYSQSIAHLIRYETIMLAIKVKASRIEIIIIDMLFVNCLAE